MAGGVPWASERGTVRWVRAHGRRMFPQMLERSAFNERVRKLWGAFIILQQVVGEWFGWLTPKNTLTHRVLDTPSTTPYSAKPDCAHPTRPFSASHHSLPIGPAHAAGRTKDNY